MRQIAIIDDNLLFRKITSNLLQKNGFSAESILTFENGKFAYDYISKNIEYKRKLPWVIFLDLNMPIIDGWSFLKLLKKLNENHDYHPKVFIITSSIDNKDLNKAKSIDEIKGYFIKPIKANDINEALNLTENPETSS